MGIVPGDSDLQIIQPIKERTYHSSTRLTQQQPRRWLDMKLNFLVITILRNCPSVNKDKAGSLMLDTRGGGARNRSTAGRERKPTNS